jgi:hypothetical protein
VRAAAHSITAQEEDDARGDSVDGMGLVLCCGKEERINMRLVYLVLALML